MPKQTEITKVKEYANNKLFDQCLLSPKETIHQILSQSKNLKIMQNRNVYHLQPHVIFSNQ